MKTHVSYCVIISPEGIYIERMRANVKVRVNILGKYKTLEEALEHITKLYEGENNDKKN